MPWSQCMHGYANSTARKFAYVVRRECLGRYRKPHRDVRDVHENLMTEIRSEPKQCSSGVGVSQCIRPRVVHGRVLDAACNSCSNVRTHAELKGDSRFAYRTLETRRQAPNAKGTHTPSYLVALREPISRRLTTPAGYAGSQWLARSFPWHLARAERAESFAASMSRGARAETSSWRALRAAVHGFDVRGCKQAAHPYDVRCAQGTDDDLGISIHRGLSDHRRHEVWHHKPSCSPRPTSGDFDVVQEGDAFLLR